MLEINETAKRAIATNGGVFQSMVAMEECSELVQAISKCIREPHDEEARKHLVEEMADVLICLGQLKSIYQVTDWEQFSECVKQGGKQALCDRQL